MSEVRRIQADMDDIERYMENDVEVNRAWATKPTDPEVTLGEQVVVYDLDGRQCEGVVAAIEATVIAVDLDVRTLLTRQLKESIDRGLADVAAGRVAEVDPLGFIDPDADYENQVTPTPEEFKAVRHEVAKGRARTWTEVKAEAQRVREAQGERPKRKMTLHGESAPFPHEGYIPGAWDEVRRAAMAGHISDEAYELLREALGERIVPREFTEPDAQGGNE